MVVKEAKFNLVIRDDQGAVWQAPHRSGTIELVTRITSDVAYSQPGPFDGPLGKGSQIRRLHLDDSDAGAIPPDRRLANCHLRTQDAEHRKDRGKDPIHAVAT
jgi:hypothetical protein